MALEILQQHRVHGGTLRYLRHASAATGTPMRFSLYTPPGEGPHPYVIWLSGLTCTEDNSPPRPAPMPPPLGWAWRCWRPTPVRAAKA